MHSNLLLSEHTTAQIDVRVEKILKDLGSPEPPLNLEDVRRLLKLDLAYYSTADTTWLNEKIHQLKVAGKQVLSSPTSILNVTKLLALKGLLLTDRRRILLDTGVAAPKLRWNEAHEITHDVLPWHEGLAHGDPEATLSPECHEIIEAEANYGAGRLLFCGAQFVELVRSSDLNFDLVKRVHQSHENTLTTTLWRVIEASQYRCFGLITCHPKKRSMNASDDVRYFVRSPLFATEYTGTTAAGLFDAIAKQCHGRKGPIGAGVVSVQNDRSESRSYSFETFWNGYQALTLAHTR
jgi:hypothetical protein